MSLLFIDSFDHYPTADISKKYSTTEGTSQLAIGTGRFGSGLSTGTGSGGPAVAKTLVPGSAVILIGFAFKQTTAAGSGRPMLMIGDASVWHIGMGTTSMNHLVVGRGPTWASGLGTTLGTASRPIVVSMWHYVELKITINDSTGTVDLKMDGSSVLSLSSQDTRNGGTAAWTQFKIGADNVACVYDDLYVCDDTGSAPFNAFLGDVRVDSVFPNANGNSSMSTPSTGTDRYATVDEASANGDTDYNTLASASDKDTLNFGACLSGVAPLAVQTCLWARKTDAGAGSLCPVIRHSGTDYDGTAVAALQTYMVFHEIFAQNPGAGPGAWTEADFNAAEFGYKRTA